MKLSRSTVSPGMTRMVREKMGPAKAKVWNSPRSPQGSTAGGREASRAWSKARPAKERSRTRGSMQVRCARRPAASIWRASWAVETPRSGVQTGKMGSRPVPARRAMR